jgi:hypothetical protein
MTRDKQVRIVEEIEDWSNCIGAEQSSRSAAVKWLVVMGLSSYRQGRRYFQSQRKPWKPDYERPSGKPPACVAVCTPPCDGSAVISFGVIASRVRRQERRKVMMRAGTVAS